MPYAARPYTQLAPASIAAYAAAIMRITITKGQADDGIAGIRDDGSRFATRFPKKGPLPHDAVHLFVEQELGLRRAFWGMVAGGYHPEEIAAIAHAAGHASASRAQVPQAHIVELLQAERIVECFEADLWSGGTGDPALLIAVAATACADSFVPLPTFGPADVAAVRDRIHGFSARWLPAASGHGETIEWREGD